MDELEQIVRRLALSDPWFVDEYEDTLCRLCEADPEQHADDCPWVQARLWAASNPT